MFWEKMEQGMGCRKCGVGTLVCNFKYARQGRTHQEHDIEVDKGLGPRDFWRKRDESEEEVCVKSLWLE